MTLFSIGIQIAGNLNTANTFRMDKVPELAMTIDSV